MFMSGDLQEARKVYHKLGSTLKEIECLDLLGEWEEILFLMDSKREEFFEKERNSIYKKYSVLAYDKLLKEIESEEPIIGKGETKETPVKEEKKEEKGKIEEDEEDDDSEDEFDQRRKEAVKVLIKAEEQQEKGEDEEESVVELKEP